MPPGEVRNAQVYKEGVYAAAQRYQKQIPRSFCTDCDALNPYKQSAGDRGNCRIIWFVGWFDYCMERRHGPLPPEPIVPLATTTKEE